MRPLPEPELCVLAVRGPVAPGDVPGLCARLRALLAPGGGRVVLCDVRALGRPDAVAVEALARLQLGARRRGRELRLRGASGELLELLELTGLRDAVPPAGAAMAPAARAARTAGRSAPCRGTR